MVEFRASSPEDWQRFQNELVPSAPFSAQKEAEERIPISRFLDIFYEKRALDFPLRLVYATDTSVTPDFQLYLPSKRIAIEVTQVTAEALRAVQNNPEKWPRNSLTMATTLLSHGPQPKALPERVKKVFQTPNFLNMLSCGAQRESWFDRFSETVEGKSEKRQRDSFDHGDEDWLLIWDRLPTALDTQTRAAQIEETLHLLQPQCTFNQVYVLDEFGRWLIGARWNQVFWESKVF